MQTRSRRQRRITFTWWLCCCLGFVLPAAGVSTLVTTLLGPMHVHSAATAGTDTMRGWTDFRRASPVALSVVVSVAPAHGHTLLGRHHHAAADPTVVAFGADAHEDDTGAASSGASLVFASAHPPRSLTAATIAASADWRIPADCRFASCAPRRLERPPSTPSASTTT